MDGDEGKAISRQSKLLLIHVYTFFHHGRNVQCWLSPWFYETKKSLIAVKGCRDTMSSKIKRE